MNELVITSATGKDVTTSLIVAEIFGKEHKNVLQDVRNLNCSDEFHRLNFQPIKYIDSKGRKQIASEFTKDGFSFLVMGYNGAKAGEFKERFINEFNKHAALLQNPDYILAQAQRILYERIQAFEHQLKQKDERLQLQEHVIQQSAPKVEYYNTVLQSETGIAITVIANELGMSAQALNKLLKAKQIIRKVDGVYVLFVRYQGLGFDKPRTIAYTKSNGEIGSKIELYWTEKGRQFIHGLIKKETAS